MENTGQKTELLQTDRLQNLNRLHQCNKHAQYTYNTVVKPLVCCP